jgi:hypothetical protein
MNTSAASRDAALSRVAPASGKPRDRYKSWTPRLDLRSASFIELHNTSGVQRDLAIPVCPSRDINRPTTPCNHVNSGMVLTRLIEVIDRLPLRLPQLDRYNQPVTPNRTPIPSA